jgi:hypothetical protein
MGQALHEAYADVLLIKSSPSKDDKDAIQGKFKSYHNASDRVAQLMTSTFFALLALADTSAKVTSPLGSPPTEEKEEENVADPLGETQAAPSSHGVPGLYYNIQVHLPATNDIEVYNAIFRSLKEHLFGT